MKHRIYWALVAVFAAMVVALGASMAPAGSYVLGEGGYYWKDGVAYQDHGYWWKSYYTAYTYSACGCYKYPYQTYEWKWHYDYRPVKVDYKAADAESQIIQLAAYRDKEVLKIAASAQRSQAAAALADQLGLSGNFNLPNYGNGLFPEKVYRPGKLYDRPLEQRVQEYQQTINAYGVLDLSVPMQQNGKLQEMFLQSLGGLNAGQVQLIAQALAGQERVATIDANGKIAVELLKNAQPAPQARIETRIFGSSKGPAPVAPVGGVPQVHGAARGPVSFAVAAKACVQCHNGASAQGKFDITAYHPATASRDLKKRVYDYVVSDNGCPKGGERLPESHVQALIFASAAPPEQLERPPVPEDVKP